MSYRTDVSYTAVQITPSATDDIPGGPVRWIDVLTAGNVSFVDARGNTVTLTGLPAGYAIKCVVKRVLAAGTTATGFVGYP